MAGTLFCSESARLSLVRADGTMNAIEYLEVLDDLAPAGSPPQQTLLVHCVRPVAGLDARNVMIEGGVRVRRIPIAWAFPADAVPAAAATPAEQAFLATLPEPSQVLVVRTGERGDFSTYTLRLVLSRAEPARPPAGFDPRLASVDFSFKVECPSDFDCAPDETCPEDAPAAPQIDYMAKDYASFRRLMLDRLTAVMPAWTERNPADVGVALVELLAYAADRLSYFQDAVATEAYLGTARRRVSLRRHARLLDYPMHDGANARVWVHVAVSAAAGLTLERGTPLLTRVAAPRGAMDPSLLEQAVTEGATVFETLHAATLFAAHNEIRLYTWGDERCCLLRGATEATLENRGNALSRLAPGDVLVLEEVRGARSGRRVDADLSHRHAVRLTDVRFVEDPLVTEDEAGTQPLRLAEVRWGVEDALPFALCLWEVPDEEGTKRPVAVARGNVVLADHGRTLSEPLPPVPADGRYRPLLGRVPVAQQARVRTRRGDLVPFDRDAPAGAAFRWDMRDVRPALRLVQDESADLTWTPQRDLLNSDRFARELVVEVEDDGSARLRFGDGVFGRLPTDDMRFTAVYRTGNGPAGNVGAESIAHVVTTDTGVLDARNPMPARGGTDPEPAEQVRLYAPAAFRRQERAVTEADYAETAQRHPDVQRAAATRRWTGSWYTVFVTVDRRGGRPVDRDFRREMRAFLERFRLAGEDLEIDAPRFVPLDIVLTVCADPGHFRADVKAALLEAFSSADLPDGTRGFFHPDNFSFGDPVYLSRVIARAMQVPGVQMVEAEEGPSKPNRFRRWGEESHGEQAAGRIAFGRLEIARLDNDPNRPENGRVDFVMKGGL